MSWLRRSPSVQEGPGSPIELSDLAGQSGHLLFAHGIRAHQMVKVPCQVLQVERAEILITTTGGRARPGAESAVILEVILPSALVQCFTTVQRAERSGALALRVPARPHVVQRRRNQRVDIYLGVTLHTPDRPIEEIPAQMINLSLDGAACVLTEPIAPGTAVTVNLSPLGLTPAQASGEVVRCVPTPTNLWVIGLRFQGLRREQEAYLTEYIARFTHTLNELPDER